MTAPVAKSQTALLVGPSRVLITTVCRPTGSQSESSWIPSAYAVELLPPRSKKTDFPSTFDVPESAA